MRTVFLSTFLWKSESSERFRFSWGCGWCSGRRGEDAGDHSARYHLPWLPSS